MRRFAAGLAAALVWVVGAQAAPSCRFDADCPSTQRCVAGRGPCDGAAAATSSCVVRSCVPVASSAPPRSTASAVATLHCPAGASATMALAFRLPDTDPPLELWYRLPPADLLELRAGPLVLAPSRRLDGRGHACTAAAARCAPFEVLHVKIRTADPAATGMLWASLRWRSAGTPADLHAAVSTRIGLAPGSRCD